MRAARRWSVRHAAFLDGLYGRFEWVLFLIRPLAGLIGYKRLERPVVVVERHIKGALFDCQMCGQCALSHTGMSCPMNCPKNLRNGPCGGVRQDGTCEVDPEMECVWVAAWEGAQKITERDRIMEVQPPVDNRLKDTSSWLRVLQHGLRRKRNGH